MKKKLVAFALCFVLAFGLFACGNKTKTYNFDDYDYTNPTETEKDWRDLEGDADMTVDGVIDEEHYTGLKSLDFVSGYEGEVDIKATAYLGQKGVYVAVTVQDDYIFYMDERTVYNNTSIELHIAALEAKALTKDVVQLRFGVNGYTEQWIGVSSPDGYAYTRAYVPCMSRVKLTGEGAALNSHTAGQGWVLEAFVPYTAVGLTEKPEALKIGPAYNHVRTDNISNPERKHADAPGMSYLDPGTFGIFDETGYNADASTVKQGYLMGNGSTSFAMTSGWNVNGDTADAVTNSATTVLNEGSGEQYIFVKNYSASKFYFETQLTFKQLLKADDNFPKFGITLRNDKNAVIYYADGQQNQTKKGVGALEKYADGAYDWSSGEKTYGHDSIVYKDGTYLTLAILRDGDSLYYIVNEILAFTSKNVSGFGAADKSVVGLFSFNSEVEYKNIKLVDGTTPDGSDAVDAILSNYVVTATEKTIDGDLSDWTDATVNANISKVVDKEENGKSVEFRSYMGADGLYIMADAHHAKYINSDKTAWWKNTNLELQINGTNDAINHRWVVPDETGLTKVGGGISAMVTEDSTAENANDRYHTTVEVFIPYKVLPGYTVGADSVRLGIAFKTIDDQLTTGHADYSSGTHSDWWYAAGHQPDNVAQHYFVMADGMFDAKPIVPTLTIDADLSDWENTEKVPASVKTSASVVKDAATDKGFTVRAFLDDKGMYVAYEAKHAKYTISDSTEWWQSFNAEIKLFGENQSYINAKNQFSVPAGGQIKMTTVDSEVTDAADRYTTVMEMFIPAYSLETLGYKAERGYVKAGFALKSVGDSIAMGGDHSAGESTEYWWAKGHGVGDIGTQYYVTAQGLQDSVGDLGITIDSDFTDWDSLANIESIKANTAERYDTDETRIAADGKCGFTVYTFTTEYGVYLFYDVTHHVKIDNEAGDGDWYRNTNVELWSGTNNANSQANIRGHRTPNMRASFVTTPETIDGKSMFRTRVEAFIPAEVYTANADGTVKIRFAFRSDNGREGDALLSDKIKWGTADATFWDITVNVGADGVVTA